MQDVLALWTRETTNEGFVTLRFDNLGLTGTDGSPILQNPGEFRASIRSVVDKVRAIVSKIAASLEGHPYATRWEGMPTADESNLHIMLHPSNTVYGLEENEVAYVIKAFTTILAKGGAYREAFADPQPYYEGQKKMAYIGTTKIGGGKIYNCL